MDNVLESVASLLPVLAGALIALSGLAIKSFFARKKAGPEPVRSDGQTAVLRGKLERLAELAHRTKAWTGSVDHHVIFDLGTEPRIESPVEEMQVIADVYFPALNVPVLNLVAAAKNYEAMAHNLRTQRINDGQTPDSTTRRISEAYDPIIDAVNALTDEVRVVAKTLV